MDELKAAGRVIIRTGSSGPVVTQTILLPFVDTLLPNAMRQTVSSATNDSPPWPKHFITNHTLTRDNFQKTDPAQPILPRFNTSFLRKLPQNLI